MSQEEHDDYISQNKWEKELEEKANKKYSEDMKGCIPVILFLFTSGMFAMYGVFLLF